MALAIVEEACDRAREARKHITAIDHRVAPQRAVEAVRAEDPHHPRIRVHQPDEQHPGREVRFDLRVDVAPRSWREWTSTTSSGATVA